MAHGRRGPATFDQPEPVIRRHRTPAANLVLAGRLVSCRSSTGSRSSLKCHPRPGYPDDAAFGDAAAGRRGFPCPLAAYGCSSTFGSKNEWKRHVYTQHMRLGFWRCDRCSRDNPDRKPNDFNRKDLFIQHVRRMHHAAQPGPATASDQPPRPGDLDEQFLQAEANRCYRHLRSPPENSRCLFCDQRFHGHGSWEDRMEHVGRHMERARKDGSDILAARWNGDQDADAWFLREGVLEQSNGRLILAEGSSASLPRSPASLDLQPPPPQPIAPSTPSCPPHMAAHGGRHIFAPTNGVAPATAATESPSRFPSFSGLPMGDTQKSTPQQLAQERKADRTLREKALFRPATPARQQQHEAAARAPPNRPVPEPPPPEEREKRKTPLEELAEGGVSWYFACVCDLRGDNIDDGTPSVACESCETWQHAKCLNISPEKVQAGDFIFVCARCQAKGVTAGAITRKLNGHPANRDEDTTMADTDPAQSRPTNTTCAADPLGAMVGTLLERVEDLEKRAEPLARQPLPATISPRASIRRSHSTPASLAHAFQARGTPTPTTSVASAPAETHPFSFRDLSGHPSSSRAREDPELRAVADAESDASAASDVGPRHKSEPPVPPEQHPWHDSVSIRPPTASHRPTFSGDVPAGAEHAAHGHVHKRKAPQEASAPTIEVIRDFGRPPPDKRPRSAVTESEPSVQERMQVHAPNGYHYPSHGQERQQHPDHLARSILPLPSPGHEAPHVPQHQAPPVQHAIPVELQPRFIPIDHAFLADVQRLRDRVCFLEHHLQQVEQRERQAPPLGGRQYFDCSRPCVFQCVYHGTQIHGDLGCTMRQQGGIPAYPSGPGAATAYAMPSEREQHTQQRR